jgi:diaminopimelate decarboxylase
MKPRIFPDALLRELAREHGTPLYIYDAATIRARTAELAGFDRVRYAQKANSNLAILRLIRSLGAEVDAVSAGEIARARAAGFAPHEIVFTADLFDQAALESLARELVPVNLGSPFMIEQYAALLRTIDTSHVAHDPRRITLRVNPGFGHGHARKVNTGGEESKHGLWHADLEDAIARATHAGLSVSGLHVHIGSGTDFEHLASVCDALKSLAPAVGDTLERISAGGGLSIPYRPDEARLDVARFTREWLTTRAAIATHLGREITLEVEPGRYLVAESGILLAEVRGTKRMGALEYVFIDAGFHTLLRPALYGAYHAISVVGRDPNASGTPKVIAGPLCESGDVLTQRSGGELDPRPLPDMREGDLVCIHDAGAYGASMASGYNSQPLPAEVLVNGTQHELVRRRQSIEDLLRDERGR